MTTAFVPTPEYPTLDEWMADSDYWPSDACGGWLDAEGNEVDPLTQWLGAMEAAGTEYLTVEIDTETGAYRLLDQDGALLRQPERNDTLGDNQAVWLGHEVARLFDVDTAVYSPRSAKPTRAEYLARRATKEAHRG